MHLSAYLFGLIGPDIDTTKDTSSMTKNRIAALLSIFLLAFFCCQCCSVHLLKPTSVQLARDTASETVALLNDVDLRPELHAIWPDKIDMDKEFVARPICSGVMVADGTVISANHCLEGYKSVLSLQNGLRMLIQKANDQGAMDELQGSDPQIVLLLATMLGHIDDGVEISIPIIFQSELSLPFAKPDTMHWTKVRASYPGKDLLFLDVKDVRGLPAHRVAKLAPARPPVGSHIEAMGMIVGETWTYREGVVAAYRSDLKYLGLDTDGPFMQMSMLIGHGDSGGGVYSDTNELIGIMDCIDNDAAPELGFAISVENIRAAMIGQKLLPAVIDTTADNPEVPDASVPSDGAN